MALLPDWSAVVAGTFDRVTVDRLSPAHEKS